MVVMMGDQPAAQKEALMVVSSAASMDVRRVDC